MAAVLAENYQLKWHSHNVHLHSSVAMLYRSDNFTDVTLVTSDGRYLAAHRFVLSSCSSYLNRVLHLGAINGGLHSPSAPLVVILPPEISYRTMSILLQYMYSGEATVSNDQLNGVLRAGELLRVKGLCHAAGSPNKDKEKRYFGSGISNQSETHSRAGSANSGRMSASYFQTQNQPSTSSNKTPDPSNANNSNSAGTSKTAKTTSEKSENQGPPQSKSKEKKQNRIKERETRENAEVCSNNGEGCGEIVIEENMKIELLVKEEPIDWDDDDEMTIDDRDGQEVSSKSDRLLGDLEDNNIYAPLTCDLCQETFTTPALWVRHIEKHPVTDVVPPKKRKRPQGDDENDDEEFQLLRCELCQKMYTSPADWVRHIQTSHTEEQLALNNSSRRLRKSALVSCPSCSKSFPSLASMLIHSRTHTGEKPYVCCVCEKGFNVKSNLLRHLRTLHDHLISPDQQFQSVIKDPS